MMGVRIIRGCRPIKGKHHELLTNEKLSLDKDRDSV